MKAWSVKYITHLFYLQTIFKKKRKTEPNQERVRGSRPPSERERPVTWTWNRLHRRLGCASHRQSTLFLSSSLFFPLPPMSPIYPFSLYPCWANHRKMSNLPWPSCFHRTILPPLPLDRTQSPLSLPSSLNLTRFDEFFLFGFVSFLSIEKWYYIFVWKLRKCEH